MSSSHDTSAVRPLRSNFFDSLLFHPFLCPGNFGNRSGLLKYFVHFRSSSFSFYAEDFHASQVSDVRPSLEFIVHGIDLDGNGDADVDRDSYPIGHLNESTPSATNSTSDFPFTAKCSRVPRSSHSDSPPLFILCSFLFLNKSALPDNCRFWPSPSCSPALS